MFAVLFLVLPSIGTFNLKIPSTDSTFNTLEPVLHSLTKPFATIVFSSIWRISSPTKNPSFTKSFNIKISQEEYFLEIVKSRLNPVPFLIILILLGVPMVLLS